MSEEKMENERLELVKKIKALADFGTGGEKINATKMLNDLMKKYSISESDLNNEKIKEFDVKWSGFKGKELLGQVFRSVVGYCNAEKSFYLYTYFRNSGYVKCTTSEYLEFEAKLKFYKYHLKKDVERMYVAFVNKNNIFPPKDKQVNHSTKTEWTEEDEKIIKMCAGMEEHAYHKQIKGGN